jgi:hypothetical protein
MRLLAPNTRTVQCIDMKIVRAGLIAVIVLLAGCESFSDAASGVRERIAGKDSARVQTFAAEPRATYEAVRTSAQQMGYRFIRGGAAQGEFEGLSGVGSGDRSGTARQLAMKVKLERSVEGGTQLTVRITEIIEADSSNRAGQATETPLRDTPQYDVFLRRVQQAIDAPATGK